MSGKFVEGNLKWLGGMRSKQATAGSMVARQELYFRAFGEGARNACFTPLSCKVSPLQCSTNDAMLGDVRRLDPDACDAYHPSPHRVMYFVPTVAKSSLVSRVPMANYV